MSAPACDCHGRPMRWAKDERWSTGGRWRCDHAYETARATRERPAGYAERKLAYDRARWHAPNGGYIRRRRRDLAQQRAQITERLTNLTRDLEAL